MNAISNYFKLNELNTNIHTEVLAGFTTFISMSYILFVNPNVLGAAGMNQGAVFTATALSAAFGTLMMGLYAKYPIATAPALGINAFFSYSVVIGMGVNWQTALRVPGAIFIGMAVTAIAGLITGLIPMPHHVISGAPSLKPTFGVGVEYFSHINTIQLWVVVLTFLLVTFFDTAGTLVGLAQQAGFMKDNKMPRVGKALMSDSSAMLVGSILGTSPVGAYVESSAGIAVGGRSGLTSVVTAICFILGMFFSPLLPVVTNQVTAPALIIVGVLMAQSMKRVHWEKLEIAIPAFLIVIGMPLTYSISDGMALGLIMYPLTIIAAKRGKEVHPIMYALFFIFIVFIAILNVK